MKALGYQIAEDIVSELSGLPANDLHHIESRGMGATRKKNNIENLMALTREEHEKYGDKKKYKEYLLAKHMEFLENNKIPFDKELMHLAIWKAKYYTEYA